MRMRSMGGGGEIDSAAPHAAGGTDVRPDLNLARPMLAPACASRTSRPLLRPPLSPTESAPQTNSKAPRTPTPTRGCPRTRATRTRTTSRGCSKHSGPWSRMRACLASDRGVSVGLASIAQRDERAVERRGRQATSWSRLTALLTTASPAYSSVFDPRVAPRAPRICSSRGRGCVGATVRIRAWSRVRQGRCLHGIRPESVQSAWRSAAELILRV